MALADPAKLGEDIAAYYFPGSEPASLGDLSLPNGLLQTLDNPIWVNLGRQVTLLEFVAVGGPLDLCLSNDGEGACPKPEQPQEGERWQLRRIARNECGFFHEGELQGTAGVCRAAISWPEADGVRLRHGEGRNKICSVRASEECEYRHGELKIRDDPVEVGFHVVLGACRLSGPARWLCWCVGVVVLGGLMAVLAVAGLVGGGVPVFGVLGGVGGPAGGGVGESEVDEAS